MARVVFYCHDKRSNIDSFEYYKQDVEALEALGHEVVICTRYREIPLRFDAMLVWWWTHALYPVLLCRLLGRPCLITGVFNFRFPPGFVGTDYFKRPAWQRWLIAAATRFCRLNLFIDEVEAVNCAAHFGIPNTRHYPLIIHEDYLQGPATSRKLALFNLAWSAKSNLIRKGIPELLKAVRLLKDQGVEVNLYLAGLAGDGAGYLAELIEELGIKPQVTQLGALSREQKIENLRTLEIYVQPSHYEGFGLAAAEAMGSGACVITCDVGAVRTVVGDAGIYVAPGSPEALAGGIRQALSDQELRGRLQQAAHQRATRILAPASKRERLRGYLREVGVQ